MMKVAFLSSLFLLSLYGSVVAQSTASPQPTRYTARQANTPNDTLANSSDVYQYYDAQGRLTSTKTYRWQSPGAWIQDERTEHAYNTGGKMSEVRTQRWDQQQQSWFDYARTLTSYTANGLSNIESVEQWDQNTNAWRLVSKILKNYTAQDKLSGISYFSYQSGISSGSRDTILYDALGRETIKERQVFENNTWRNDQRTLFEYEGNSINFDTSYLSTGLGTIWQKPSSMTVQRRLSNRREWDTYTGNPGDWKLTDRRMWDFTPDGQISLYHNDVLVNNTWTPFLRAEYAFHPDGALRETKVFLRNYLTSGLYWFSHVVYDYKLYVTTSSASPRLNAAVFPNPATDGVTVRLDVATGARGAYRMYAYDGRLLAEERNADGNAHFPMTNMPAGTYLIWVESEGRSICLPLVKQ